VAYSRFVIVRIVNTTTGNVFLIVGKIISIMDIESLLLETLSTEQLEERIALKIKHFHGLLTREVAMKLIAKEKGLLKEKEEKTKLKDVEAGTRKLILEGKVKKVWPLAVYKSGKRSRVVEIEDETGSMPLVLWNDDVALASRLRSRDAILVKGANERGGELHLGYSGALELLERAPFSDLSELKASEFNHISGFVSRIDGFDRFVDEKTAGFGFSFYVTDGAKDVQVIIFGNPDRGRVLKEGDEVILENALEKNGRLELSSEARILSRRAKSMLLGSLEKLEETDDRLRVVVGEREVEFDRENALKFLGVVVADDIKLSTLINLKKDYLLNTNVAIRIKETDGLVIVEK
jgi:hypothetical protein